MLNMYAKQRPEYIEAVDTIAASTAVTTLLRCPGIKDGDNTKYFLTKEGEQPANKDIRVTQQFISHFKEKRDGLILTTTSLAGEMGLILDGVYAADKWAVTGMCEMLYYELAPYHIQVKTLVPGVVKTSFKMDGAENMPKEYQRSRGHTFNICPRDK